MACNNNAVRGARGAELQKIQTGATFAQDRAFPFRRSDAFSFARACNGDGCFVRQEEIRNNRFTIGSLYNPFVKREFEITLLQSDRTVKEKKRKKNLQRVRLIFRSQRSDCCRIYLQASSSLRIEKE